MSDPRPTTPPRDLRLAAALALAAVGLAIGASLTARESFDEALAPRDLGAMTPAALDTVAFGGRRLTASLSGYVTDVRAPDELWIADAGDAFRVVFPEAPGLGVEDRVLVVGRLRGRGGRRWLEASAWTPVVGTAR